MVELGKIPVVKAYRTTDGRIFTGKNAREDAEDHQRWLDRQEATSEETPPKKPLKKRKRKKRKT